MVVLQVPAEAELHVLAARLSAAAVPYVPVVESDGELAGQMTAIGLRPGRKEGLRRHLSSIPLLR